MPRYWLLKSEPEVYSIDDLKKDKTTCWEGVRNYQARNFMWKEMSPGDRIIFYHSNATPSAAVGICEVVGHAVPDPSQFDRNSPYFEPKSSREEPRWWCREVRFVQKFKNPLPLEVLREDRRLSKMALLQKGSRLSVTPVTEGEFEALCLLGGV